jgi:hypothetical protein
VSTQQTIAERPLSLAGSMALSQSAILRLALLTPAIFFLHGYHPFADDAGIYVSGIQKLADPGLYQPDAAFVLAHTHLSLFAHVLAWVVRITAFPLEAVLLAAHLASIFLFLLACWRLAERFFATSAQRWCSVVLAGACFTLPIAGTALSLMDPYVTARSFSTPLGLFALVAAIDRRWWRMSALLLLAAVLHPLMTIYAAGMVLLFLLADIGVPRAALLLSGHALALAAILFFCTLHQPVSAAYREAILSRSYIFPSMWQRFEYFGIGVPLILFASAMVRPAASNLIRHLCFAACLLGITGTLIAFLFVHPSGPFLIARLQPLRCFQILYTLGVLLLGGLIGKLLFEPVRGQPARGVRSRIMAVALLAVILASLYAAQRGAYPNSAHVELPGHAPRNPWKQAFVWIRANTPHDAVFAANPHLVFMDGEDAQGFRATAQRSLLADDKDEGVVVVFPKLAEAWAAQRNPQAGIDKMSDEQRLARLRPPGATWIMLPEESTTSLPCPYHNATVQVCRLEAAQ